MNIKKEEFVKTFLPDKIEDIIFAQIDLDITDLSLSDVLRNVNNVYPHNSRTRNAIISGRIGIGLLCKSELLHPISGILFIISDGSENIEIVSRNYIVIGISEERIRSDEEIKEVLDDITRYVIKSFRHTIFKFDEFYIKFIYDQYEMEMDDQENFYIDKLYRRLLGKE